jgi:outer membrane protein, heavy metal efflux system
MLISAALLLSALQAPVEGTLTLEEALRQAFSTRGRAAAALVAEARAGKRLAGQVPNPTIGYQHTGDTPHQHFTMDQSLEWLLTRGSDRAAAEAVITRAGADSALALARIAAEVRESYFGAVAAAEALRLTEEQAGLADSLARIARRRFETGDISRFEADQTAQEGRRGRQLLSGAREAARGAEAALARAIGWSAGSPPAPGAALDLGLDADGAAAGEVAGIPAVRAAVADSLEAARLLTSARRGRVPLPSLTGGADWDDPSEPGKSLAVLGFSIPLPIWNRGDAGVALASARAELAASAAREARLEASRAVAEARAQLEERARRARFSRDSLVPAARELRRRAVAAYAAGQTGALPVLDALRGEREVVLESVQDLLAFQTAVAAWHALFGRPE